MDFTSNAGWIINRVENYKVEEKSTHTKRHFVFDNVRRIACHHPFTKSRRWLCDIESMLKTGDFAELYTKQFAVHSFQFHLNDVQMKGIPDSFGFNLQDGKCEIKGYHLTCDG